jgi:ligand-binding SRPBCC domain-containing protein
MLYKVNNDLTIASQAVHTSSKTCDVTIGAPFKAYWNHQGQDGQQRNPFVLVDIAPKVTLTVTDHDGHRSNPPSTSFGISM